MFQKESRLLEFMSSQLVNSYQITLLLGSDQTWWTESPSNWNAGWLGGNTASCGSDLPIWMCLLSFSQIETIDEHV